MHDPILINRVKTPILLYYYNQKRQMFKNILSFKVIDTLILLLKFHIFVLAAKDMKHESY
jgi:hypothetical protein